MKKEREDETAKHIIEQRNKRHIDEQQTQQSINNGFNYVNQQDIPLTINQPIRQPSPPPYIASPAVSTLPETASNIYMNISTQSNTQDVIINKEENNESARLVHGVNVSSILRQRKVSSSSSKNDDDEWNDNYNSNYQNQPLRRSPSPTSAPESGQTLNNNNEGIRCIARYSYQRGKYNNCQINMFLQSHINLFFAIS